jgi:hypothetical protein
LPRASKTLVQGCAAVTVDHDACVDVAATQLVRYATCELIGRL